MNDTYGPSWYQVMGGQYTPSWYKPRGEASTTAPAMGLAGTGKVLTGAASREYNPAFGGIPQVTDPNQTIANTIQGNLSNLQSAGDLAGAANLSKATSANAVMNSLTGGQYTPTLGQLYGNVQANARGQLPSDVIDFLRNQGAAFGVARGTAGSDAVNSAVMRALGIMSTNRSDLGLEQFGKLQSILPNVNLTDPNAYLLGPEQALGAQASADIFNAAPSPEAANAAGVNALNTGMGRGYGATGYGGNFGGYTAPVVALNTPMDTTPVTKSPLVSTTAPRGSGVLTDSAGNTWTYNPDGTMTQGFDNWASDVELYGTNPYTGAGSLDYGGGQGYYDVGNTGNWYDNLLGV